MKRKLIMLALSLALATSLAYSAEIKITEFVEDTDPSSDDLMVTVDSPASSPVNKKVTKSNWQKIPWNSGLAASIPATCGVGQAYYASDTKVLYICTASNTWQDYLDISVNIGAIADLTFVDASVLQLTGTGALSVLTSGGNNYILGSNSDNSALEFKTPANVLTQIAGQPLDADLTTLAGSTAWRLFYSNGSSAITQLALGTDGQYLKSAGADQAPTWDTPEGTGGDVTKVGDCASGDCLDGSSDGGTYIKFYDGTANSLQLGAQTAALGANKILELPATCADGEILGMTVAANTWTMTCLDSLDNVTLGGFTAGYIPQIDGSGNLTEAANVTWTGTVTAPIVSPEVFIDCDGVGDPYAHCTALGTSTLTAALVSRTIINSYGRGEAQTATLPTAAAGMTFIAIVGTQHNSALKVQKSGTDTIIFNGTAAQTYFQEVNQAVGSRVSCFTFKTGAAAWTWMCGSSSGTWTSDADE